MSDVHRSIQKQGGRLPENRPARGALPLRPSKFRSAPAFLHCSWGRHWSLGNGTPDTEDAASGMPAALAPSSTIALYACLCSVLPGSRETSWRCTTCERLRRQDRGKQRQKFAPLCSLLKKGCLEAFSLGLLPTLSQNC